MLVLLHNAFSSTIAPYFVAGDGEDTDVHCLLGALEVPEHGQERAALVVDGLAVLARAALARVEVFAGHGWVREEQHLHERVACGSAGGVGLHSEAIAHTVSATSTLLDARRMRI
ncbi:unnamed protein product [Phytophthora fragariaefolia]|uniref:Unnamed protein product n=1 Tax=Phytophthora fragariaefolia TaxID=1490495 RepID=A0A9W6TTX8_9STRA|nr:unnamed protein product [Phytophthora fragariaefolia]